MAELKGNAVKKTAEAATEMAAEIGRGVATRLSRRRALLAALLGGAAVIRPAKADESCSCLAAPDCSAVCENGGSPRGDGTQACDCFENPKLTLSTVAYTGRFYDLENIPNRALSKTDGGDAVNSEQWGGMSLRLQHNTNATQIPVITGQYMDYMLVSELGVGMEEIGAQTFSVKWSYSRTTWTLNVSRDAYGRLSGTSVSSSTSNCCNCGDDGR